MLANCTNLKQATICSSDFKGTTGRTPRTPGIVRHCTAAGAAGCKAARLRVARERLRACLVLRLTFLSRSFLELSLVILTVHFGYCS